MYRAIPILTEEDKKRYFSKISIANNKKECWVWNELSVTENGYGLIWIKGGYYVAHRVAYYLHYGVNPMDLNVCHKCDNPKCNNPHHLFLGTHLDNNQDCAKKNRTAKGNKNGMHTKKESRATGKRNGKYTKPENTPRGRNHYHYLRPELTPRGEKSGTAKLNNSKIIDIRISYFNGGVTLKELGIKYNVHLGTISKIVNNKIWTHLIIREENRIKVHHSFGHINFKKCV